MTLFNIIIQVYILTVFFAICSSVYMKYMAENNDEMKEKAMYIAGTGGDNSAILLYIFVPVMNVIVGYWIIRLTNMSFEEFKDIVDKAYKDDDGGM